MPKLSAGLLPFRRSEGFLQVFLVHPGGPFWARKDLGAWSIAKGEPSPDEDPLQAAIREFREETGFDPRGPFQELGQSRQPGGKIVQAWAFEGDFDPSLLQSNTFTMSWPPRSGRLQSFPEVDRAEWFTLETARKKILPGQVPLLEALGERFNPDFSP